MRLPDLPAHTVEDARAGDLTALGRILAGLQPGIYNLAMRMLRHREDARDATQDILLRIVTHLGTLREPAALGGWAFQVAPGQAEAKGGGKQAAMGHAGRS